MRECGRVFIVRVFVSLMCVFVGYVYFYFARFDRVAFAIRDSRLVSYICVARIMI